MQRIEYLKEISKGVFTHLNRWHSEHKEEWYQFTGQVEGKYELARNAHIKYHKEKGEEVTGIKLKEGN